MPGPDQILMHPSQIRGSAFGLLATVQAIGNIAASAIAGLLNTVISPSVASAYLAVRDADRPSDTGISGIITIQELR